MAEKTDNNLLAVRGESFSRDFGLTTLRLGVYATLGYAAYRFLMSEASTRIFEGTLARYFEEPRILCTTAAVLTLLAADTAIQRAGLRTAYQAGHDRGSETTLSNHRKDLDDCKEQLDALQAQVKTVAGTFTKSESDAQQQLTELLEYFTTLSDRLGKILGERADGRDKLDTLIEAAVRRLDQLRQELTSVSGKLEQLCKEAYKENMPKNTEGTIGYVDLLRKAFVYYSTQMNEKQKELEIVEQRLAIASEQLTAKKKETDLDKLV